MIVSAAAVALLLTSVSPCAEAQSDTIAASTPLRLRDRLEAAGAVILGVGFLPAAVAGMVMPTVVPLGSPLMSWYPVEAIPLPIVGPALYAASLLSSNACGPNDATCQGMAIAMIADAALQLVGLAVMVAGPLVDRDPPHRASPPATASARRLHWSVGAGPASAPLGLSFRITDF